MPQAAPAMVEAWLNYLVPGDGAPQVRIYPPSSGLPTVQTALAKHRVTIRDVRPEAPSLRLDEHGFELHSGRTEFADFFDEAAVRASYYPDVQQRLERLLGARAVVVYAATGRPAGGPPEAAQTSTPLHSAHGGNVP